MKTTISCKELKEYIERMGLKYEPQAYSGRGMFGRKGVGLVFQTNTQILNFIFQLGIELGYQLGICDEGNSYKIEEPLETVNTNVGEICVNNLGRDFIVYFPWVEWEE